MNESQLLANFLASLQYRDLGSDVASKVKDVILDQLGIELAASTKPWSKAVYKYVRGLGNSPESTVVNYGDRVKAEHAAFANATFGHGFEMDDTHFPSTTHPGSIIVPAAMAIGQRQMVRGRDLILAVASGYEAAGRIGRVMAPSCLNRGFHSPAVVGPFGAAVATAKVLGFGPDLMLNAIALAGSHSSGTMEYTQTGGSVKRIHAGIAASGGIRAALLAQARITGPWTVLEGKKGIWHAFSDDYHPDRLLSGMGSEFMVTQTSYKRYPSCHHIQAPIEATLNLVRKHRVNPQDVQEIVMGTSKAALGVVGTIKEPKDLTAVQFSAPFSLAMCVVRGRNKFQDHTEENLVDPEVIELSQRVRLEVDAQVEAEFPAKRSVRMTIKLKDGTTYQEYLEWPKGTPENPMTRDEVKDKFRDLASVVLSDARMEEIIGVIDGLDDFGNVGLLSKLVIA